MMDFMGVWPFLWEQARHLWDNWQSILGTVDFVVAGAVGFGIAFFATLDDRGDEGSEESFKKWL